MSSLEAEQSIMKITAVPVLRPEFRAASGLMARLSDFAALMKPRIHLVFFLHIPEHWVHQEKLLHFFTELISTRVAASVRG